MLFIVKFVNKSLSTAMPLRRTYYMNTTTVLLCVSTAGHIRWLHRQSGTYLQGILPRCWSMRAAFGGKLWFLHIRYPEIIWVLNLPHTWPYGCKFKNICVLSRPTDILHQWSCDVYKPWVQQMPCENRRHFSHQWSCDVYNALSCDTSGWSRTEHALAVCAANRHSALVGVQSIGAIALSCASHL